MSSRNQIEIGRDPRFVHPMQVRFADTDAQGHVYFSNYLVYCDEAFAAYMNAIGYPWKQLLTEGIDMFYKASRCTYSGSARFEDVVRVHARVASFGRTSVTSEYRLRGADGAVLAEAELVSVCVDPKTRAPTPVPEALRAAVAAYEQAE